MTAQEGVERGHVAFFGRARRGIRPWDQWGGMSLRLQFGRKAALILICFTEEGASLNRLDHSMRKLPIH
jgi:hypothetical protein